MAKPNYQFEKRQRDLRKKQKQDEKRQRKAEARRVDAEVQAPGGQNPGVPPVAGDPAQ